MKRVFYVLAATAALALAAPTLASAEKIVIKSHDGMHGRHHHHHDRGWDRHEGRHHHHHGGKTVIIKRSHRDY